MTAFRDRFTDDEWAFYRARRCCWTVEFGNGRGIRHCGERSARHAPYRYCPDHETERREVEG